MTVIAAIACVSFVVVGLKMASPQIAAEAAQVEDRAPAPEALQGRRQKQGC
jgi:hypothetical protein